MKHRQVGHRQDRRRRRRRTRCCAASYPTTEQGLADPHPGEDPQAEQGRASSLDPWGHEYVYLSPGQAHADAYDVKSYGADGAPGGEGENADLVNN